MEENLLGSKYLCLDCGEVYESNLLNINDLFEDIFCPKTNCCGTLIEIDELLLPTIKLLNNKGYTTKYCCSGHYSGQHPQSYIMFDKGIDVPYLPKGFKKETFNNYISIVSITELKKPTYKDFYQICDNAKILLKWAIGLPDYEED